jgi:hypothetical protein
MPTETRDRDPYWGRMFMSSAELEALKEEAAGKARRAYDATTCAIAGGLRQLGGPRDAPVDKLKVGMEAEMRKANAAAPGVTTGPATPKPAQPAPDPAQGLLDVIAQAEVKGHPLSYDVTFGFGKYDPEGYGKPVTAMTVDELARFQRELGRRSGSSAVGKYQITSALMPDLRRKMRLSGAELYDGEMQERMGRETLAIAGYYKFLAGEIDAAAFQDRLARYWASVPKTDGKSAYGQPLGVSMQEVQAAIARSKAEHDRVNALRPAP